MAWHFDQQPNWEGNHGMSYTHHSLATPGVDWRPTAENDEGTPTLSPNDGPPFPTYLMPTPSGDRLAFREPSPRDWATRQTTSLRVHEQAAAVTSAPSPRDSSASHFALPAPDGTRLAVGEISRQGRNPQTQSQRNHLTENPRNTTPLQCKWEGCRYLGGFQRVSELIRHIRNLHITPGAYPCPVPDCDKICNREDNLLQHMRTRHRLR